MPVLTLTTPWLGTALLLVLALVLGGFSVMLDQPREVLGAWICGVAALGVAVWAAWRLRWSARLTLDRDGLTLRTLFGRQQLSWQAIERVSTGRRALGDVPQIRLRSRAPGADARVLRLTHLFPCAASELVAVLDTWKRGWFTPLPVQRSVWSTLTPLLVLATLFGTFGGPVVLYDRSPGLNFWLCFVPTGLMLGGALHFSERNIGALERWFIRGGVVGSLALLGVNAWALYGSAVASRPDATWVYWAIALGVAVAAVYLLSAWILFGSHSRYARRTAPGYPPARGARGIHYVVGDVTELSTSPGKPNRPALVVQICSDTGRFDGAFLGALARRWPNLKPELERWFRERDSRHFELGAVHWFSASENTWVGTIVAQHGRGPRHGVPAIRYTALRAGLCEVARFATQHAASVHLPRLGCGAAGGAWEEVEPLLVETLVASNIETTVHDFGRPIRFRAVATDSLGRWNDDVTRWRSALDAWGFDYTLVDASQAEAALAQRRLAKPEQMCVLIGAGAWSVCFEPAEQRIARVGQQLTRPLRPEAGKAYLLARQTAWETLTQSDPDAPDWHALLSTLSSEPSLQPSESAASNAVSTDAVSSDSADGLYATVAGDAATGERYEQIALVTLPTPHAHEAPLYLDWSRSDGVPTARQLAEVAAYWETEWGARLVAFTPTSVEFDVTRPPGTHELAVALLREHIALCPGVFEPDCQALAQCASSLVNQRRWLFWWD